MARKPLLAAALAAALFLLLCSPAPAQEPTPLPAEEGAAQEPGGVFFYLGGELTSVPRDIAGGGQMVEFSLLELLQGPNEDEEAAGYVTYIPEGVKLQYTTIKQDRSEFTVNLSHELLQLSAEADAAKKALTQIVKTVQEAAQIQNVGISVAGEVMGDQPRDAFEALGVSREATGTGEGGSPDEDGGGSFLVPAIIIAAGALVLLVAAAAAWLLLRGKAGKAAAAKKKKPAAKGGAKKPAR